MNIPESILYTLLRSVHIEVNTNAKWDMVDTPLLGIFRPPHSFTYAILTIPTLLGVEKLSFHNRATNTNIVSDMCNRLF